MLKLYLLLFIFSLVKSIHLQYHKNIVKQYFEARKSWVTSNLGAILFKNQIQIARRSNVTYVVLIWKHFDYLKKRHIYRFSEKRYDPLDECSVRNCKFIGRSSKIDEVDAVVVHLQYGIFPKKAIRNPKQIWIFMSDESPNNIFTLAVIRPKLEELANIFNWSMTYRTDSDIPIPYGRTVALQTPLFMSRWALDTRPEMIANYVPYWNNKTRDVLVTVLITNCYNRERIDYIENLQKYIEVDVHGMCSNREEYRNSCSGHLVSDCKVINKYLFYLAFENSKCRQYVSEKSFNNAYAKGAIPIIMGSTREDSKKLLPPNSFLHVDDFASPKELADEISLIAKSNKSLLAYHRWRNHFEVRNEKGYFGIISADYCRICEALNINERSASVYDVDYLRLFLDPKLLCY